MANTLRAQKLYLKVRDLSGGVNTKLHATVIPDNTSVSLQDIDAGTPGLLKIRSGYTQIANTAVTSNGQCRGLFHFAPDAGTEYLCAISNENPAKIYRWSGSGNFAAGVALTDLDSQAEVNFAQANNKLYMVDGTNVACSINNSGTYDALDEAANATFPVGTRLLAWWLGRMWTGGKASEPGTLWFSDALAPETWDRTNQAFKIAYGTGQQMVAIVPLRNLELVVFMNESTWRVIPSEDAFGLQAFGVPTGVTFRIEPISETVGCGAQRSVAVSGHDMFFLDQYGQVRSLRRTELDTQQGVESLPLSDNIESIFPNGLAQASISKCVATFYRNKYLISYPETGQTNPNKTFAFDLTRGAWSGPWSFGAVRYLISDIEGQQYIYCAFVDSANLKVYRLLSGTTDNSTTVQYIETTKRYTFDDLDRNKTGKLLVVSCVTTSNANMTVEASVDGAGFSTLEPVGGSFNLAGGAETLPQSLPFDLGGSGVVRGRYHLDSLGSFNDIQFRFTVNTSGADVQKLGHTVVASMGVVDEET